MRTGRDFPAGGNPCLSKGLTHVHAIQLFKFEKKGRKLQFPLLLDHKIYPVVYESVMNRIKTIYTSFVIWGLLLSSLAAAPQKHHKPLIPYKTDTPPVIDGVLDDQVWNKAPHETGFKTWYPDYGINMVENTVVYYAYDRENLYFAYRCFDSQPDKIKSSVNSRDNILSDDWICINLDTFNDHWIVMLGFQDIAKDFHTETGYLTRKDITRFRSGILRMFYPDSKILKRIDPMIHSTQIRDKSSGLYETYNSFDTNFLFLRNSSITD